MRARRVALAWGLGALAAGPLACGGFTNEPLRSAAVGGLVVGADPSVGWVSVMGRPELRTSLQQDGRFLLEEVPAEPLELVVVASSTHATRQPVWPRGGRYTELGDVVPLAGAFLLVRVVTPEGQPLGATVEVEDTPYRLLPVDASGALRLGPLGAGCYEVHAALEGFNDGEEELCLAPGQEQPVTLVLSRPGDESPADGE